MKKLTALTIFIASVFILSTAFAQVYPEGMVSYWKFDEGSGTIATDSVGTNDGTLVNGPVWTSGQVDGALSFDGADDYVEIYSTSSLNPTVAITVEAWVYAHPANRHSGIVEKGFAGSQYALCTSGDISPTGPKPRFILGNEGYMMAQDSDELPVNQWVHVVGTFDGNYVKLYVNGQLKATTAWSGTISTSTDPLKIGRSDFANFNGIIDEIAIYNRALTPEEIQQHYQNGLNGLGYGQIVIQVTVDVKPGSCPNPLNVKSKGVLPIAILGTEDFDVNAIDAVSVRLAGVEPLRSSYEDVTTPVSDGNDCNCITDGPDGFLDLTLKFETQRIVEAVGDVNDGDVRVLTLTGVLFDPMPFETPIEGADCIVIRGRHKPINPADINKDGVVNAADFAIFAQNWLQSSIVDE